MHSQASLIWWGSGQVWALGAWDLGSQVTQPHLTPEIWSSGAIVECVSGGRLQWLGMTQRCSKLLMAILETELAPVQAEPDLAIRLSACHI